MVKKGDTLLILDDRDQRIKVGTGRSGAGNSREQSLVCQSNFSCRPIKYRNQRICSLAIDGQIERAKVAVWQTTQEFDRYANLIKDHSVTQQQYEDKLAAKELAEKQLVILQQQRKQANSATNAVSTRLQATASQISIATQLSNKDR